MKFLLLTILLLALYCPLVVRPGLGQQPRVLVFSKTVGFRHDSIPDGIAAIRQLAQQNGFEVDATEDAAAFTDANLNRYQAVVFLSTTGDVLDGNQQAAVERYVRGGGGFAGVHSATDTEYDWPWYGGLVGAYFQNHPEIQRATIRVEDAAHLSVEGLPGAWERTDEWYNFRLNPRGRVKVLARLDESTYAGGTMGADHPICWCQLYDGGRSWYTAGGHTKESYAEPLFRQHLLGGIQFAAKIKDGDCSALASTSAASFRPDTVAGESVAALFGTGLSETTQMAMAQPLPTQLAGVSVKVRDGAGIERPAPLFFVSPTQINFLVPPQTADGAGFITAVKADGTAPSGTAQFAQVVPGLFAANANGQGVAAGLVLRVSGSASSYAPVARFDPAQNRFIAVPIEMGTPDDQAYLVLFATGLRNVSSQSVVRVKVGEFHLAPLYAGPQSEFAGLDQINVKLPAALAGRGEVSIECKVGEKTSNIVQVEIR